MLIFGLSMIEMYTVSAIYPAGHCRECGLCGVRLDLRAAVSASLDSGAMICLWTTQK
jgi:hypothetical protein